MVVRSWHNRAHSLLSLARRAQPKEVSSASHSSSLLSSAIHSSSLLSSATHSSSLLSSAIHSSSLLSSARRAQLCEKRSAQPEELNSAQRGQLGQKSSALRKRLAQLCARGQLIQESSPLTKEVISALRKRSTHLGELSSDQRGQLNSAQEVRSSRRAQLCPKRSVRPEELVHSSSFQTLPNKKVINWAVEVRFG